MLLIAAAASIVVVAAATAHPTSDADLQTGLASWYGDAHHGRRTASGDTYDQEALTAAHRSLPFGTIVRVTNAKNGRTVEVRINDRGPMIKGRIVDLSRAAARRLGALSDGVVPVRLLVISPPASARSR
jgi:rare lipoprotein A